jgi:hypothetical protein
MRIPNAAKLLALLIAIATPLLAFHPVFAATPDGAAQINNFLKNMINIAAGLSGTIATGALVYGGIMYMISAGDLKKLDRSKAIIKYAAIGLIIVIAAAAITNLLSSQANSAFGG